MDTRDGAIYTAGQVAAMCEADRGFMQPMVLDPTPEQRSRGRIGRNAPCPCGSRKKFKLCCLLRARGALRTYLREG